MSKEHRVRTYKGNGHPKERKMPLQPLRFGTFKKPQRGKSECSQMSREESSKREARDRPCGTLQVSVRTLTFFFFLKVKQGATGGF